MTISPLAGKLLPPSALVDVPRLVTAYFTTMPDPANPAQRVSFGTSGHRGSALDGTWLGTLHAGPQNLRLQLNVKSDASGHLYCTLDSLDQHAMGLECDSITANGRHFSFQVPSVHGDFTGTLSADSKSISGTWSQGASLPLTFTRR